MVNIKPAHGIGRVVRNRVVSDNFLAEHSGFLGLRKVGEDLLDNIGYYVPILVLSSRLFLSFERFY